MKVTLKAARVNAGLSQQAAADLLGVDRVTLHNWESGKTKINKANLIALSNVYNTPMEFIILPTD
jgi:transcriptional regulator with XRE-family HTH domain